MSDEKQRDRLEKQQPLEKQHDHLERQPQLEKQREHLENLRAVYSHMQSPPLGYGLSAADAASPHAKPKKRGARAGIAAAIAVILGKLKFLGVLGGLFKFKTLGTMLLSMALYGVQWGFPFAIGFVLLIFVHETGLGS